MAATLIKTVEAGDSALLAQLLADGADVNKKSAFSGNTALHAAAGAGQMEMVTTLLEHGANVDAALKHVSAFDVGGSQGRVSGGIGTGVGYPVAWG